MVDLRVNPDPHPAPADPRAQTDAHREPDCLDFTCDCEDLARFIRGEVDPAAFPHREHVRMAFELLRRVDFGRAAFHYSSALRVITQRVGRPQAFHQTITIAFLAVIAERMELNDYPDFDSFAQTNPDLLDKGALSRWYRPERLASDAARRTFVLPEPSV